MTNTSYHILTLGCQMNKSDSERISALLKSLGCEQAAETEKADFIIVNACSVRQKGIDRIYGLARNWQKLRKEKNAVLILTGCILDDDKNKLGKQFDFIFDTGRLDQLKQYLSQDKGQNLDPASNSFEIQPDYAQKFSAFVPIMTGCNNFCSYCVVPYTRNREQSRSVRSVLKEITELASNNCLQITLLGQNVNSYNPADIENFSSANPYHHNFAKLLWEINQIPGIRRIHFTAPHPKDMSDEVIDALALPKHVNYLHLPLQSGDNEILKKMNRQYTIEEYLELIEKIKHKTASKQYFALGTDLIVGFPTETDEQFMNTSRAYQKIGFDISYTAMYSPRKQTAAFEKYKDDVPREKKKQRWQQMAELMEKTTLEKNQAFLNKKVEVLVEESKNGFAYGNSLELKRVKFPGSEKLIGQIVQVEIRKIKEWELEGAL